MKRDLDALLGGWPAPPRSEAIWEGRAEATAHRAVRGPRVPPAPSLFEAPSLSREAGEPREVVPGGGTMSDDKKQAEQQGGMGPLSEPGPSRPRPSLRALAERANQSRPPSASAPALSTPLPVAPPLSGRPPAISTPIPGRSASSKPADTDDSGIVDLDVIRAGVTQEEADAATRAQPAQHDLFASETAAMPAAAPRGDGRARMAPAEARAPAKKGPTIGIAIAVVGIAAAVALAYKGGRVQQPTPPHTRAQEPSQAPAQTAAAVVAPAGGEASPAESVAVVAADLPSGPAPAAGGPVPASKADEGRVASAPAGAATAQTAAKPGASAGAGDLASAMEKAVGGSGQTNAESAQQAEPAAGAGRSSTIPEQPPQGSVTAAMAAVMGAAKACVAGADDVSRATVTFASNGSVGGVTVSGWASSHGAAACVQTALKGAKVGPFSKPSYQFGVTIRP